MKPTGRFAAFMTVVARSPQPVARPPTQSGSTVARVVQTAGVERQASAPDARVELTPQRPQQADAFIEHRLPRNRETGPVTARRRARLRECVERGADLLKGEPDLLRHLDERHSAKDIRPEPPMATGRPLTADESVGLVEAKRRSTDWSVRLPRRHSADDQTVLA